MMLLPSLLSGAAMLASAAQPAAILGHERDPFRVSCGERVCRIENRHASFHVTRSDVTAMRILGFGPGTRIVLHLGPGPDLRTAARPVSFVLHEGSGMERSRRAAARETGRRSVANLVAALSSARTIYVENCNATAAAESASGACDINLEGLDNAVELARHRLTVARRRW